MAQKKLSGRVAVDGVWYGPGDDVPAEIAERITNPKAWAEPGADGEEIQAVPKGKSGTSTGARLSGRVAVAGAWYGPDDVIPDEVAAQIKNPKAWEDCKLPEVNQPKAAEGSVGKKPADAEPAPAAHKATEADASEAEADTAAKARRGPSSSRRM